MGSHDVLRHARGVFTQKAINEVYVEQFKQSDLEALEGDDLSSTDLAGCARGPRSPHPRRSPVRRSPRSANPRHTSPAQKGTFSARNPSWKPPEASQACEQIRAHFAVLLSPKVSAHDHLRNKGMK